MKYLNVRAKNLALNLHNTIFSFSLTWNWIEEIEKEEKNEKIENQLKMKKQEGKKK